MGSTRSLVDYESGSTTLLGGVAWKPNERTSLDLGVAWNRADAGLDRFELLVPATFLAANPNMAYDFSATHQASDLDLTRLEATLDATVEIRPNLAVVGGLRWVDVEDDAPYLEDLSGSLTSWSAALRWRF